MGEDIRCRPVSGRVHEAIHEKEWYRVGDNPSSLEKRDGVFFTHFYISIKKIDARDVQGIKFRRTRNMMNYKKYVRQYFMPPVKCMKWAEKEYVDKAPIWCSVDLRDGNQALVIPMSLEQKIEFFKLLVKIGFKEIEVGFPAASETEYEFLRALIEQNLIPEDVTIQVLTQAREHIIRKTFEAVKGAPRAIIHVYNSTSLSQREQVFRKSKEEIRKIAVDGAALLKKLADETEGNFQFEYSPESFTGTEPEYALEVCNAVLDVWKPTPDQKAIINLPVTVEHSMPHVYASQVEYMCDNLNYRENVIVSLHPHNDRGCGVADSELGLLAGADRIFRILDEKPELDEGYVTLVNAEIENGEVREAQKHTGHWAWKHYHKADNTTTYQPLEGDVVFNGVDFGYDEKKMVLHDIKLFAKPGQKIAFVGSTGAGKTTITNLINRFYDIQDGKIRYDGININKIKKADLRRSLGIVLQDTQLFTNTVMENIRYGKLDATDEEVIAAAKLANADGFIRRLPDGYQTKLTNNGANLSQGQRQLLSIARAAVADPPVLILDEATSSIDTRTEKLVQDGMDKLMHGRTTFVIAHRLSTVRNSDCIMVLENGRIIERGTHDQLIEEKGKYYQLYTGNTGELA